MYNRKYKNNELDQIAYPMGGIGAGMICLDGCGSISNVSIMHKPEVLKTLMSFGALSIKGYSAKVLEGQIPYGRIFASNTSYKSSGTGNGLNGKNYGLPRYKEAEFSSAFPFATIELRDVDMPIDVTLTGFSPFILSEIDNSSLPCASVSYTFKNTSDEIQDCMFSYNSEKVFSENDSQLQKIDNGFLYSDGENGFTITCDTDVSCDGNWFRGGWFDPLTMLWKDIESHKEIKRDAVNDSKGTSLYSAFTLDADEIKTIIIRFAWYVPNSSLRIPADKEGECSCSCGCTQKTDKETYTPRYASLFNSIDEVTTYWAENYDDLVKKSRVFTDCFYSSTLPDVIMEAITANLSIIKSPTILRQHDGKLWAWEGCCNSEGCCSGSCTHVWNYAQSLPHLFPELERTLRQTEFNESQAENGHQNFRSFLPIREADHNFYAASDGQLGGIMKLYREWKIIGDNEWLTLYYDKAKSSLDYCIATWDPKHKGVLEEAHHNTYDIEFWGADGMCSSFYLGAIKAFALMSRALGKDNAFYCQLYRKGKEYMETELFNGEFFIQKVQWTGLVTDYNTNISEELRLNDTNEFSPETIALIKKEGPKYQYGEGCISDGVLGDFMARACGLGSIIDEEMISKHLLSVYKYNLKKDLRNHANPQRPGYALGNEGGLLLCTWPNGNKPSLPFVYSDEVWTGIEYQVAAHLAMLGHIDEATEIVTIARDRYDGIKRNPFNEYECGHWYARAMSSFALLQGFTGIRYDATSKTLFVEPNIDGNFSSFISTRSGFGLVNVADDKVTVDIHCGTIDYDKIEYRKYESQ